MKAMFKKVHVGSKIKDSLCNVLTIKETRAQRYGRWENGNPICPVCGEDKFKDLDADIWSDWKPSFCPNCGARMDGADQKPTKGSSTKDGKENDKT